MNPALDLLYRLAALGFSIYCARKVWLGFVERRIMFVSDSWLVWSRQEYFRDTMPIRYWMQMSGSAFGALLCLVGAIVGWQPNV